MSVDIPRAWEISQATALEFHDPNCSFRTCKKGMLCDCFVLWEHPEQKGDRFYGAGGNPIEPNKSMEYEKVS
jgi:hypothetical protein